jgi:hypothetical protein
MWCGVCQQEVPAVVSSSPHVRIGCARCGAPLSGSGSAPDPAAEGLNRRGRDGTRRRAASTTDPWLAADADTLEDFAELDEWDFEETLVQSRQRVDCMARAGLADSERPRGEPAGASAGAADPIGGGQHPATTVRPPSKSSNAWAWGVVACGLAVATCGGALTAMGLFKPAPPLWHLGLPLLLVGQFAVLSIVVWHLDVVWHSHRATFVALHAVDEQVRQLRPHVAPLAVNSRCDRPAASTVTEPTSPHMLLAHLRAELAALSHGSPGRDFSTRRVERRA